MKRALLTGGAGFVGANLARRLLAEGHEVHLLVRPESRGWRIDGIRRDVRVHAADLSDAESVSKAVRAAAPDWIFHLAAHGSYSSQTDLDRMIQTNLAGTAKLLESCERIGFEAFVHAGSSSEYGYKDHAPAEEDWLEPNSPYAVTKAAATLFCRYRAQKLELPITTLRLYSVYGPYEEPTRLMPTLIRAGLGRKLPPLVNPDIARDYVNTEDVNEAFLLAAQRASAKSRGAVYNVGTGIQTTIREVVALARRTFPISEQPRWGSMPDRQWDTGVWVADRRRIERELGWKPRVPFEEGFARMVEWVRENPTLANPR